MAKYLLRVVDEVLDWTARELVAFFKSLELHERSVVRVLARLFVPRAATRRKFLLFKSEETEEIELAKALKRDSVGTLRIALVGVLILVFTFLPTTPAEAAETGRYVGTGNSQLITTFLSSVKTLWIFDIAPHGQGSVAYTNDIMQGEGPSGFINGNKRDTGITIHGAQVNVTNPDFIKDGVTYIFEAREN